MTASRAVLLFCDFIGCNRSYTGSERIWAVRRAAKSDGWIYIGSRHCVDLCPKHSTTPEQGGELVFFGKREAWGDRS